MQISDDSIVSIHYILTNDQGEQLDSSSDGDPLVYLHGAGNIIPGLESALIGQKTGDKLKVTVQPDEGYGAVNPDLIQALPHDAFKGIDEVKPGMQLEAESDDQQVQRVTVTRVSEDGVEIDANHPLAGQVLHFEISIEAVRKATTEEISHGHAH